jgi:threonine dehydrogenase-like Zn-dependent dehydrogenase
MRASVFFGPGDIRVEEVPDAALQEPTDALVRVTHACICGSDLWVYRGELDFYGEPPGRTGHEFVGVIEDVGAEVRTLRRGQRVIAPWSFSDGTCDYCQEGLQTSCAAGGFWGGREDGGQGEAVRVPFADGTLVPMPDEVDLSDDRLAAALAALTDVMGTGHHGALAADVRPGGSVVVVGDGAVGLCAISPPDVSGPSASYCWAATPIGWPSGGVSERRTSSRSGPGAGRAGARAHRRRCPPRGRVRRHG